MSEAAIEQIPHTFHYFESNQHQPTVTRYTVSQKFAEWGTQETGVNFDRRHRELVVEHLLHNLREHIEVKSHRDLRDLTDVYTASIHLPENKENEC